VNTRGSNLDTIKRHNLAMVLGLVHRNGPLSRSDLTRRTGLNRSTVGSLVGELASAGLVVESGPDGSRGVGRPSPVVRAHPDVVAIAVNPEVDAITVGAVRMHGEVVVVHRRDVADAPTVAETVELTGDLIERVRGELPPTTRIAGIGAAVPGLVQTTTGIVRLAPHLGWVDEPFAAALAERTGVPAVAANDASLGAAAEHTFGAGRGASDLIYLNGGASGIGGGIIAGGHPLGGAGGYAGEFGHALLIGPAEDGATLEDEVSRTRLLDALGLDHADPVALEEALLGADAPRVVSEAERQASALAVAVRNAINILNPQRVILGGFLAALFARDERAFTDLVARQTLPAAFEQVDILRAELGPDLLMIAAAELVFDRIIDDPAAYSRV